MRFSLALLLALAAGGAHADEFPSRPLRLVVPAAAGGTVDLVSRAVSQKMADLLGQPIVVENRAGATTSIAEEHVAKSAPDGYTLLMSGITLATQPYMRRDLPYDPLRDFSYISLVATSGNVIVVNNALPVRTVAELIQLAKSSARPLHYGTPAFGSTGHLAAEMFNQMAGTQLKQVPYKGAAPALQDLIAGQIEMTFDNIPAAIGHIRAGRIRPIAVTSATRSRQLPEVPTIAEAGLPGYEIVAWFGMTAPARVPPEIINRLYGAVIGSLRTAEVRERLDALAFEPAGTTPAEFLDFVKSETDKLGKVIRAAGMQPQ
jgi:tripartite-type tricarboxylate transporter receptor subunit TctC